VLEPDAAIQIVPGRYQVVAVIETPGDAPLGAGAWHGRAESEPVNLTIEAPAAKPAPAEVGRSQLQLAYYFQKRKDWAHALASAQSALIANPNSIHGHIVVGQVKEAQGDLKGALGDYQTALDEFDKQYPGSYEPPQYLILKTSLLSAKLHAQDHQNGRAINP